jgi:crossover junction endodeoxyribonuclease RusA
VKIELPLPPRDLHPNARVHWAAKARRVKAYRYRAYLAGCVQRVGQRHAWAAAEVHTTFHVPDRRRRDPDGLMASLKAAWDGLVDAGILADDDRLVIHAPTICVDRERPRVEIEVCEVVAA